ncbi:MAG: response regulator, partial [Erythrobacter sp.]|nr:response regulator [Erythrobacter sp.]
PTAREVSEWLLLTIGGTTLTFAVFYQTEFALLFMIPPVVVAHAFRLGALGTAFSVMKVATIALICTQAGRGPINLVPAPLDVQILILEAFLASSMVVGLPVAAVLATRDKVSAELAAGRRQLALLADNITDAILRYDIDGRCTYASPSVESVLGLPPSDFVGRASSERVHPDAQAAVSDVEEALLTGRKDKERFTYRRYLDAADGSPVFIEADCAIAYNSETGEREGIVVSARDVTNRIELERKLKRATAHAENAARAKSQFLANMSHEIRTPMNGVLGFADLLTRLKLDPEAARYADLIVRSGRSMMMLLNDILDISKIESGQLTVAHENFDLPQLISDCERLHKSSAEAKGIRLTAVCLPDVPRFIRSDPLRLRQIVLNLLGNAVKFTERGEVAVKVDCEPGELIVTVEDSGIGIAPKRLKNIFDPFVQEEASTTRRYGGTGLGLSISRQLAELLGGSLDADSKPDVGSRFVLRLPFELANEERKVRKKHSRRASDNPPPTSGRILLAEDHDVNRMLVTAMLEQLGQRVETAHDGNKAVEAVIAARDSDEPYDLVLMDIQMPECDGYSATRRIRRAGLDPNSLPIVALTANAFPEDIDAAQKAGMQAHLAKPLVFEELAQALARWMLVHIVDEDAVASAPRTQLTPSNAMEQRWNEWKGEAMEAVDSALREDALEGAHIEDLARTVHKLAGSAGMFGEVELGEKAAALERALRASVEAGVRRKLAQELLELA